VLDPAGLRIDLLMFSLIAGDDATTAVENDKTRAGCSLIEGAYVIRQMGLPFFRWKGESKLSSARRYCGISDGFLHPREFFSVVLDSVRFLLPRPPLFFCEKRAYNRCGCHCHLEAVKL
jgi:hypothetical protein